MRFQSTLPRGERRRNAGEPGKVFIISIHAPARGATHSGITLDISIHLFQSTLPRGERRYGSASNPADTDYFNPRSREGSDKPRKPRIHAINYFNPRSREGSDHVGFQHALAILLFQSTLPRGERRKGFWRQAWIVGISIHAPARGATGMEETSRDDRRFQSTLPRGERL